MLSWRVEFQDGPLQGQEHSRTFIATDAPSRIAFAPIRHHAAVGARAAARRTGDGWMIVGVDSLVDTDEPWPGQIVYRCHERHELAAPDHNGDQGYLIFALEQT